MALDEAERQEIGYSHQIIQLSFQKTALIFPMPLKLLLSPVHYLQQRTGGQTCLSTRLVAGDGQSSCPDPVALVRTHQIFASCLPRYAQVRQKEYLKEVETELFTPVSFASTEQKFNCLPSPTSGHERGMFSSSLFSFCLLQRNFMNRKTLLLSNKHNPLRGNLTGAEGMLMDVLFQIFLSV